MAYRIDPQTGRLIPDGMPFNYQLPQMPPQAPPQAPPAPQGQPLMAGMPQTIQMPEFQMSEADKQQALKMALFNAGSNILSNMGPSRMPVSGAQILGQAGMAGMQGYQQSQQQAMERFKTLQNIQQAGRSPYYHPLQTSGGFYAMDARTGAVSPLTGEGGKLMPIGADVNLAGKKEEAGTTGKQVGEYNMKQYETANSSLENVAKINSLIKHIESSNAITGMGAEMLKNIERARAWFGSESATRNVTDTEVLDVMMGSEVFPLIKSLGVGARGMDTPAEREFMRQVLTGSIELNKQTLLKMAKIRKDVAQRAINKWNERVKRGELNNFFKHTGITRQTLQNDNELPSGGGGSNQGGRVEVISPTGKRGSIPAAQLEEALRQGYRRL